MTSQLVFPYRPRQAAAQHTAFWYRDREGACRCAAIPHRDCQGVDGHAGIPHRDCQGVDGHAGIPYRDRKGAAPSPCRSLFAIRLRRYDAALVALALLAAPLAARDEEPRNQPEPRQPTAHTKPLKAAIPADSASAPLNLFEKHKADYAAGREPALVDIPPATYLSLVGRGEPSGPEFVKGVGAMYGAAYGVKMAARAAGRDFTVSPLEALWWGNKDMHDFMDEPRETWNWKLLIRVPDFITVADVKKATMSMAGPPRGRPARTDVSPDRDAPAASPSDRADGEPEAPQVKLETIHEGKCVQVLHIGPYSAEPPTIAAMKAFAASKGLALRDAHHDIYRSDPNTTPPDKLATILRQPVK